MRPAPPLVSVAVEGESDTGMAQVLITHAGLALSGKILVKRGVSQLDKTIPGLAQTGPHRPWVVFRDADRECPVDLRARLIGSRAHGAGFELRIACSMTEAWLLADAEGFSQYFKIPVEKIPRSPDSLDHAKRELLAICSRAPQSIRRDVVRADGDTGPLYVSRLNEFSTTIWSVERAAATSPSLARSVDRLVSLRAELEASASPETRKDRS